jgi:hypothetical protein
MVVDYPGIQGGENRNVGDNTEGQTPASYPTTSSSLSAAVALVVAAVVPVAVAAGSAACARLLDAILGEDRRTSEVEKRVGCIGGKVVVVKAKTWVPWVVGSSGPGCAPGWWWWLSSLWGPVLVASESSLLMIELMVGRRS